MEPSSLEPHSAHPDVTAALKEQHARIALLLGRLRDESEADVRPALERTWAELEPLLLAHLADEELYLFPAYRAEMPEEAEALAADHARFRHWIAEIGIGIELHTVRFDALSELADALVAHAEREDRGLYPWTFASSAPGPSALVLRMRRALARARPA